MGPAIYTEYQAALIGFETAKDAYEQALDELRAKYEAIAGSEALLVAERAKVDRALDIVESARNRWRDCQYRLDQDIIDRYRNAGTRS